MVVEIPTVRKCCFLLPLYPGALAYGILRMIVIILMVTFYLILFIQSNMLQVTPVVVPIIIQTVLIIDIVTIVYFLYGYKTNNVKYLAGYYPFCLYTLALRAFIFFMLSFFTYPILVTPYIACLLMDCYMIVLIRTMLAQTEQSEGHCEFVNKLANNEATVKIEVVDDTIPDEYKNRVYLVSDRYHDDDIIRKSIDNGVVVDQNYVNEESSLGNNKEVQQTENFVTTQHIPTVIATHI